MDGTVARAFELAREGLCLSMPEIRAQLKKEGYSNIDAHLYGASIRKQIGNMIAAAAQHETP